MAPNYYIYLRLYRILIGATPSGGIRLDACYKRPQRAGHAVHWVGNGYSNVAITKLDVLDGLPAIKVSIAYENRGKRHEMAPLDTDGWEESAAGIREWNKLPPAA